MASKHQNRTIAKYKAEGWEVVNLIRTSMNGIPDLMCLKDGKVKFIECKEANDRLSELQKFRIEQLINLGFEVIVSKAEK